MTGPSAVDALMADCRAVVEQIAEHKRAVTELTARRDVMVAELRRLGLSERTVGRLLGISGPRVNQIMNPAPGGAAMRPVPDPFEEHGFGRNAAPIPPVVLRPPEDGPR